MNSTLAKMIFSSFFIYNRTEHVHNFPMNNSSVDTRLFPLIFKPTRLLITRYVICYDIYHMTLYMKGCDMMLYEMWYDMTLYNMIWCPVMFCDLTWCDMIDMTWYDTIRHDTTRHDTTRHDTIRYDTTTRHVTILYDIRQIKQQKSIYTSETIIRVCLSSLYMSIF